MRYLADIRSLIIVKLALSVMLLAAVTEPGWASFVMVPAFTFLAFTCCIINHNHMHCTIFFDERVNRVFNVLLALAKGHTVQTVVIPHNRNHHVFHGDTFDWIGTAHAGSGMGWRRLMRYVIRSILTMARERRKDQAPQVPVAHQKAMFEQRVAIAVFCLLVLTVNPFGLFLHLLIPWGIAMAMLVSVNLLQHDGCDLLSEVNRARNFTGTMSNWVLFNNGYHAVHHRYPAKHWSLLKELHEKEIAPFADPKLQETSLFRFILKEYVGHRKFTGNAVTSGT